MEINRNGTKKNHHLNKSKQISGRTYHLVFTWQQSLVIMQSQCISTNRYTQNWRNALCVFYFVFLRYPYSRHCQEPRDVCLIIATSIIVVHTFLGRIVVYEEVVVDCPPLHDPGMVDIFFIVVVLGSYVAVSCWNIYKKYMYNIRINSIYIYMVPPKKKSTFFMGKGGNVLEI